MRSTARRTLVTAAFVLVTSPAAAAPQPMINYFQPMPIVGKLSTTVWGASTVGPRDPANGLEDNGADWGGRSSAGNQFLLGREDPIRERREVPSVCDPLGPATDSARQEEDDGWKQSIPMEAISDNVIGPYVYQAIAIRRTPMATTWGTTDRADCAHRYEPLYALVGEIVPGQMFSASSPDGPWTSLGLTQPIPMGTTAAAARPPILPSP